MPFFPRFQDRLRRSNVSASIRPRCEQTLFSGEALAIAPTVFVVSVGKQKPALTLFAMGCGVMFNLPRGTGFLREPTT